MEQLSPRTPAPEQLPEATVRICNDCPWRKDSLPGWLGPGTAETWLEIALSDDPVACHLTIVADGDWEGTSQCRGLADYRANICKVSRNPEVSRGEPNEAVFSSTAEFMAHHGGRWPS